MIHRKEEKELVKEEEEEEETIIKTQTSKIAHSLQALTTSLILPHPSPPLYATYPFTNMTTTTTTTPGIVKHIDGLDTEQIQKIGIPNGIPLVYKFDRNMKPIVQPKAVAPLSGEYLEKKVNSTQNFEINSFWYLFVVLK